MVEVLERVEKYKIQCEKCHSLLKYDKYDELGQKEYEQKREENKERYKNISSYTITHGDLYIWCPVCKNKVITTHLNGYNKYPKGEIFNGR